MVRRPHPKRTRHFALLLAGVGLLVVALPASAADSPVSIAAFAYDPSSVTITVGDTVTWTNNDAVGHTVTADDGSFNSGSFGNGDEYARTFTSAGTFAYHCAIHPAMTGVVTVEAASTPAPAATGSDPGSGSTQPPTSTAPGTAPSGDAMSWLFAALAIVGLIGLLLTIADLARLRRG